MALIESGSYWLKINQNRSPEMIEDSFTTAGPEAKDDDGAGDGLNSTPQMILKLDAGVSETDILEVKQLTNDLLSKCHLSSCSAARSSIMELVTMSTPQVITAEKRLRFALSVVLSVRRLNGYATLDEGHATDIVKMIGVMEQYIDDKSRKRPKNFLMLASPGAGKSHFIGCVADHLKSRRVTAVTFNMASMSSSEELGRALDEARNAKVDDRVPLLFLDEFDSADSNFALLLPLLWDGELSVGQRTLKLGRGIVVLAGSDPSLPDALAHAKSFRSEIPLQQGRSPKLIDLFSRINGSVLAIPPFVDKARAIDRRADKVAIAVQLLRRRFGKELEQVSLSFFRLVANATFRYDVRSIAHLVDFIPPLKTGVKSLIANELGLPLTSIQELRESSLAYHLVDDVNHAHGVIGLWEFEKQFDQLMPLGIVDQIEKYVLNEEMESIRYFGLATALKHLKSHS
jgi:hypothetical protein